MFIRKALQKLWITSVQFSRSVMSSSLRPHGLQHARLPYQSPAPAVCSDSCPSSQWCHPTISSSVIPFSSQVKSFPESGSFQMIQLLATGGQRTGTSGLTFFRMDWFDLLAVQGTLKSLFQHHSSKASVFPMLSLFYGPTLIAIYDY